MIIEQIHSVHVTVIIILEPMPFRMDVNNYVNIRNLYRYVLYMYMVQVTDMHNNTLRIIVRSHVR